MGLNDTPKGERTHIAIYGKQNAGKSSIINAVTNQNIAIVSDIKGTTTDPVYKAMELLPLGPVVIIDTPGLDDNTKLGEKRIEKTIQVLSKTDIAILVVDIIVGFSEFEYNLLKELRIRKIPSVIVLNKADLLKENGISFEVAENRKNAIEKETKTSVILISVTENNGIEELKETLSKLTIVEEQQKLVGDLLSVGDLAVLVVPIDSAAPKGRLILPQQQTIRDILESGATAVVTKETELKETLSNLMKPPRLVITDSQVFAKVSKDTPKEIMLTSFSILFARQKGNLKEQIKGIEAVKKLKNGDKILIAEGCTHHRQCDDIGTVKIPKWLKENTEKELILECCSGTEFPLDLSSYALIIHCGGCTLNKKEMQYRIEKAKSMEVPIVNYGILIAYMQGTLERSLEPFTKL